LSNKVPFKKQLALDLLNISELASFQFKEPEKFHIPKGYKLLREFRAVSMGRLEKFGFILESLDSRSIVIAFRGSVSEQDWEEDALFAQVPFYNGHVHKGFLSIYDTCKKQILHEYTNHIEDLKDKTLYITGHSLGATLAAIHALDVKLQNIEFKDIVMYNFASPRVGNMQFKSLYNTNISDSIRFVNHNDVIPNLPFRTMIDKRGNIWGYRHVKSMVEFTLETPVHNPIYNHSFEAYRKGIEQLPDSP
jgi:triacylglycerol lipase